MTINYDKRKEKQNKTKQIPIVHSTSNLQSKPDLHTIKGHTALTLITEYSEVKNQPKPCKLVINKMWKKSRQRWKQTNLSE